MQDKYTYPDNRIKFNQICYSLLFSININYDHKD